MLTAVAGMMDTYVQIQEYQEGLQDKAAQPALAENRFDDAMAFYSHDEHLKSVVPSGSFPSQTSEVVCSLNVEVSVGDGCFSVNHTSFVSILHYSGEPTPTSRPLTVHEGEHVNADVPNQFGAEAHKKPSGGCSKKP